jgi:hypothetical protein
VKVKLSSIKSAGVILDIIHNRLRVKTSAVLLRTLESQNVRAPRDVRVVGFDDVKYATLVSVPAHNHSPTLPGHRRHGFPHHDGASGRANASSPQHRFDPSSGGTRILRRLPATIQNGRLPKSQKLSVRDT